MPEVPLPSSFSCGLWCVDIHPLILWCLYCRLRGQAPLPQVVIGRTQTSGSTRNLLWERSLPAKASSMTPQALDQPAVPMVDVSSITESTHDCANSIRCTVPIANLRFAPSSWSADS